MNDRLYIPIIDDDGQYPDPTSGVRLVVSTELSWEQAYDEISHIINGVKEHNDTWQWDDIIILLENRGYICETFYVLDLEYI